VVLGATGDLTERLLLPGLGGLIATGTTGDLFLVGSGRGQWSDERWRSLVAGSFAAAGAAGRAIDDVVAATR
jgi:glucose-6-phosphate 1-dehydrogenase